jgi:hypothetical protein
MSRAARTGRGEDPTTAHDEPTFTYTTRGGHQLVLHQSRRSYNCATTLWSAGEVLARSVQCVDALNKEICVERGELGEAADQ